MEKDIFEKIEKQNPEFSKILKTQKVRSQLIFWKIKNILSCAQMFTVTTTILFVGRFFLAAFSNL